MDEIKEYTVQLSAALHGSEAYKSVSGSEQKSIRRAAASTEADDSRKRIICFKMEAMPTICLMMNLEREYEDMRKESVIQEYLAAELQICRIIQRCVMRY